MHRWIVHNPNSHSNQNRHHRGITAVFKTLILHSKSPGTFLLTSLEVVITPWCEFNWFWSEITDLLGNVIFLNEYYIGKLYHFFLIRITQTKQCSQHSQLFQNSLPWLTIFTRFCWWTASASIIQPAKLMLNCLNWHF